MAASGTMSANPLKVPWGPALVSASLEWLLIFMLVIYAILSYVITKFAQYCGLQTPCLLCSRLDHIFGNEKQGYYWDLICSSHKSEISSLVLCRAHNKLVNVNGMCESCLFSFATIDRSNAETYRLLVGKLGEPPNADHEIEDPVLGGQYVSLSGRAHCSCCNDPQVYQGYSHELIHTPMFGSEAEREPLSGAIRQNHEEPRKAQDETSRSVRTTDLRDRELHPLSHVGYTELKISSDTESEVHYSDGEDASASIHEKGKGIELHTTPVLIDPLSVSKTLVSTSVMELDSMESPHGNTSAHVRDSRLHALSHVGYTELKVTSDTESEVHFSDDDYAGSLTDAPFVAKASLSVSQAQIDHIGSLGTSVASPVSIVHGLEELKLKESRSTPDVHALSEPLLENASPLSKEMKAPVEVSKRSQDVTGTCEIDQAGMAESGECHKGGVRPLKTSEAGFETNPVSSNSDQQVVNVLDLGDAYKIVIGSKGRQMSGVLAEQWIGKDSTRVTEDLKLLLSQLSGNRGIEQPTNDIMSPKLPVSSGDPQTFGLQILQSRISLERNESGLSIDGSTVSEIEGESVLDRLKRQVEHDKKLLSSLYRELEEERNASAIASDQAMAMITRLQEEKAALHMEALQCLRMMEEQAEYDNEAMSKVDDLLAEKEKELQDLEAELEYYRIKYPHESMPGEIASAMQARDIVVDHSVSSSAAESHKITDARKPCTGMLHSDEKTVSLNISLKDFEIEKKQILQCLEKLEKALSLFSSNGVYTDSPKGNCSENGGDGAGKSNLKSSEEHDVPKQLEVPAFSGHSTPHGNPQLYQVTDLPSLGVLASNLNKRLKALEAVLEFLEKAINSFKYGEVGVKFIQEIASHLEDLRKIGIRKDQTSA